ncbi:hypothetical protein DFH94DRAFT_792251 [Russula ochroleuca]|uniref:Uncharacterized protein n=1 Tax=Russula ochroleuca TaxID=152965 RepID=A0A9P5N0V8_9AGAM|nr:hypothetical protein DFH94DRAFT_792251 [Russula ochroleuca]
MNLQMRVKRLSVVKLYVVNLSEMYCLSKEWNTPVYAFFHPVPSIDYVENPAQCVHVFECNVKTCKGRGTSRRHVRRYLDTSNGKSTSNLCHHAKICWGDDAVAGPSAKFRFKFVLMLQVSFKKLLMYSHKQHTKTEVHAEFVRWVAESMCPFKTTGRPGYYIPSPDTISRDTKKVFVNCCRRIAKILQDYC